MFTLGILGTTVRKDKSITDAISFSFVASLTEFLDLDLEHARQVFLCVYESLVHTIKVQDSGSDRFTQKTRETPPFVEKFPNSCGQHTGVTAAYQYTFPKILFKEIMNN